MQLTDITVEVRDKDLVRVGQIRPEELDLTVTGAHNNIDGWTVRLPVEHPLADTLRTPGAGIIVTGPLSEQLVQAEDGSWVKAGQFYGTRDVLVSGPMTMPESAADSTDPDGMLTVTGVSDTVVLADMLAFPDPTNIDPTTQTIARDVRTGDVESLMHAFVNANIGPDAPAGRRKARLTLGLNQRRGPVVKKGARFAVLGNLLGELAVVGRLGFRVVQRDDLLVFETYAITDRSRYIRLSIENGTLASKRMGMAPPGLTRVIVAGQDEGVDRQFYAASSTESLAAEAEWGRRIERFVDQRQTDDTDEHKAKAAELLADEGFTGVSVQAVPMSDTTMRYAVDWNLGDIVTVVDGSVEATSVVTGYVLRADSDGLRLGVILGDPSQLDRSASSATRLKNVERRLDYLERAEAHGSSGGSTDYAVLNFMGVF